MANRPSTPPSSGWIRVDLSGSSSDDEPSSRLVFPDNSAFEQFLALQSHSSEKEEQEDEEDEDQSDFPDIEIDGDEYLGSDLEEEDHDQDNDDQDDKDEDDANQQRMISVLRKETNEITFDDDTDEILEKLMQSRRTVLEREAERNSEIAQQREREEIVPLPRGGPLPLLDLSDSSYGPPPFLIESDDEEDVDDDGLSQYSRSVGPMPSIRLEPRAPPLPRGPGESSRSESRTPSIPETPGVVREGPGSGFTFTLRPMDGPMARRPTEEPHHVAHGPGSGSRSPFTSIVPPPSRPRYDHHYIPHGPGGGGRSRSESIPSFVFDPSSGPMPGRRPRPDDQSHGPGGDSEAQWTRPLREPPGPTSYRNPYHRSDQVDPEGPWARKIKDLSQGALTMKTMDLKRKKTFLKERVNNLRRDVSELRGENWHLQDKVRSLERHGTGASRDLERRIGYLEFKLRNKKDKIKRLKKTSSFNVGKFSITNGPSTPYGASESIRSLSDSESASALNQFKCPISMEVMTDPVVAPDGHTYERKEITLWFSKSKRSPVTNEELPSLFLVPNYTLRSLILDTFPSLLPQ